MFQKKRLFYVLISYIGPCLSFEAVPFVSKPHTSNLVRRGYSIVNRDSELEDWKPEDGITSHDLLLQRAIQTQIHYFSEMRNTVKAKWLSEFLNHTHLDGGEKWHCVMGMRMPAVEYLDRLLQEPIHDIQVQIEIKPAQTTSVMDVDLSIVPKDLRPWEAAAASRRRNPYIDQGPKYRTYTEELDPRTLASSLMAVMLQLGEEWASDLTLQIECDDPLQRQNEIKRNRVVRQDKNMTGNQNPPHAFVTAARSGNRAGSSALRHRNFDLLQRTTTILAYTSLKAELAEAAKESSSAPSHKRKAQQATRELDWLRSFCAPWWPRVSGVVRERGLLDTYSSPSVGNGYGVPSSSGDKNSVKEGPRFVCERMLEEMELQSPMIGSSEEGMLDPPQLANRIRSHRQKASTEMIAQLSAETERILIESQREVLERVLLRREQQQQQQQQVPDEPTENQDDLARLAATQTGISEYASLYKRTEQSPPRQPITNLPIEPSE